MTDNEKRAHDFAVSILPKMFEIRVNEAQSQEKGNVTIDLYTEYLDIYNRVLESFNRDFLDEK
ncbi:hypothetical protein [[Clostridium] symbiosum]|jgi:hypothetical protein|uniref:Uncharacterized protein n=1 Tax=Clostridium symbiosum TaxID=1512 RepID=A0AAW5F0T4_CLOSY|nr:hypothetical protein [[Clostridium] symbiosum]MCK0085200.1 hypothetical protein [[Clostridium] symbiosum]MCK0088659.1 hypothetical protein [[Clostridium] symbiosum]MDB2011681.1 hypothetical protein [[Clostridium] symbiosum]MDB2029029.1 hypothetical protein [[Clostridium] symbiosum]